VPLIDRLQVDLPNNNQTSLIYDTAKDGFILTAKKTILQNRRIFISTDNMPNQFFLLNQGIVFDNNPYDTVEINLFFNDFDPLINLRKGILKSEDEPFVFKLKGNFMLENIGKFLALLRIIEASQKEELKHDLLFYVQHAISLGSEKKVIKKLEMIFRSKLKNFDTKEEQDEKLMKSDLLTQNQKNCLKIRIAEKKIAQRFIELSEVMQKLFERKVTIKELGKINEFKPYLKTLEGLII